VCILLKCTLFISLFFLVFPCVNPFLFRAVIPSRVLERPPPASEPSLFFLLTTPEKSFPSFFCFSPLFVSLSTLRFPLSPAKSHLRNTFSRFFPPSDKKKAPGRPSICRSLGRLLKASCPPGHRQNWTVSRSFKQVILPPPPPLQFRKFTTLKGDHDFLVPSACLSAPNGRLFLFSRARPLQAIF